MEKLYGKDRKTILREFQTTEKGLSDNEVRNRKDIFGDNALKEKKRKGILKVFLNQFKDLLVGILIVAGIISIITDNVESTLVIFIVIFLNAILGTVQYFKAEQSLEALKSLTAAKCKVIRDGIKQEILSKDIVPGDILFLEAGDLIAADGRIIENHSLQVNESSLTGESLAVEKNAEVLSDDEIPLSDRKNMVFGGTLVTYGRAIAVVTSTGMNSELGKIANLMENTQAKETPLQKTLDKFSGKLAIIIIAICIIVFVLEIYRDESILNALMFAVALAVAAIPEALSSIVTIVLALGTEKMAKENAIIKDLKAVEGLGAVSVICSDKTGTLTQNKMTVQKVYVDNKLIDGRELKKDNLAHRFLINNALLCNDSVTIDGKEIGDPTEVALVNLGEELHLDELVIREKYQRISEIPFDSDRKLMSTVNMVNSKLVLFTKGALDVLINKVNYVADSQGIRKLSDEEKKEIISVNKKLSEQGLRVLAFAYKELQDREEITKEDENNYIFTGKDTQMKTHINTMASAITGVMGMPQTMKAVQVLIRMAISYGESLLELHTLFSGGEVPLIKDKTTWNLTLKTMAEQLRNKQIVKKGKKNISYKDYLKLFLLTKGNSRTVCYRMMDIMQENIASKEPGFLMENCLFSYSWKGSLAAGGVKLNFVKQCSY